ncbi:hypothetical protein HDU67_003554 [Dinochytrium kinnereticum]|nr:hypothetical protein HDU67_003554 [Dinochytrium kinnereticum]
MEWTDTNLNIDTAAKDLEARQLAIVAIAVPNPGSLPVAVPGFNPSAPVGSTVGSLPSLGGIALPGTGDPNTILANTGTGVSIPGSLPGSLGTGVIGGATSGGIAGSIGSIGTDILGGNSGSNLASSTGVLGSIGSGILGSIGNTGIAGGLNLGNAVPIMAPVDGTTVLSSAQGVANGIAGSGAANAITSNPQVQNAINSITPLQAITTGGGGIEIWGSIAKSFRKILRGGKFGIPEGFIKSGGGFDIAVVQKAYLFTAIVIAAGIGFITGIRGNTLLDKGLNDFKHAVDITINDTLEIVVVFPQVVNTSLLSVTNGVVGVLDLSAAAVKPSELAKTVGSVSESSGLVNDFSVALKIVTPVLKDLNTFASNADGAVGDLENRAQTIEASLSSLKTTIDTLNGVYTFQGVTFKRSTPFPLDAALVSKFSTILTQLSRAKQLDFRVSDAFATSGFSDLGDYVADAEAMIALLQDLSGAVTKAMLKKAELASGPIRTQMKKFSNEINYEAGDASSKLRTTLLDADKNIDNMFASGSIGGVVQNNLQKFFFFLFVAGIAIAGGVMLIIMFRAPRVLKGFLIAVVIGAFLFLAFAGVFLLLTVVFSDFCGEIDDVVTSKPEKSTLWGTPFEYLPKLFYYRENSCIKQDLGLVRFGYQMGAFPENIANLTRAVTPTVNGFDLSLFAFLTTPEYWLPSSRTAVDSVSSALSSFLRARAFEPWKTMGDNDVSASTADITTLSNTVNSDIADINTNTASTSTPPQFTVTTGTLTYEAVAASPYFLTLQGLPIILTSLLGNLNDFLVQYQPLITAAKNINTNGQSAVNQYPTIPNLFSQVASGLDDYSGYETNTNLRPFEETMKFNMLVAVEAARNQFESALPCKVLAKDTNVIQDSICLATLTGVDSLWLSFAAIGLGLFIYIPCYGCLVNRLASGKRKGKGKVDPEDVKGGVDSY